MRRLLSLLCLTVAAAGTALWTTSARADDASPFRLLPTAQVTTDGSPTVDVTPVRVGYGWRGYGYYGGWNRPYATYGYRGYYGGYRPYGYYGYRPYTSYYGGYRPYYNAYRGGWYGGWY